MARRYGGSAYESRRAGGFREPWWEPEDRGQDLDYFGTQRWVGGTSFGGRGIFGREDPDTDIGRTDFDDEGRLAGGIAARSAARWRAMMDERRRTEAHRSYRGVGPRGYTRSDDRLQEIICERLTEDPHVDATDMTVTVRDAVVVLDGTVPDRWSKYMTEEIVEDIGGVKDIRNQLRVRRGERD